MPSFTLSGAAGVLSNILDPGIVTQLTPAPLAAASGSPNTSPQTPAFVIQDRPAYGERTLNLSAVGVGGVPTTVTANLLVSYDQGATWQLFASNIALVAAGVASVNEILHLAAGAMFAVSLSTLTLGGATGVNILATLA